nr:MAG TPA: hypothetical protein [Caudoviricetes sp.]
MFWGRQGRSPFGRRRKPRAELVAPARRAGGLRPVWAAFADLRGVRVRRWDGREGLRKGQGGGGRTAAGRPPGGRASGPEGRFGGAERRRACGPDPAGCAGYKM